MGLETQDNCNYHFQCVFLALVVVAVIRLMVRGRAAEGAVGVRPCLLRSLPGEVFVFYDDQDRKNGNLPTGLNLIKLLGSYFGA